MAKTASYARKNDFSWIFCILRYLQTLPRGRTGGSLGCIIFPNESPSNTCLLELILSHLSGVPSTRS